MDKHGLPDHHAGGRFVVAWEYKVDGQCVAQVARYEVADGKKKVVPFVPEGNGGWRMGAPEAPRPLYGLDSLPGDTQVPVYVVEGEKCAAALHALGLLAITSMGGSNAADKADWEPATRYEHIVIIPDNDGSGEHYAADVTRILAGLPGARRVEVARLPGLPEKGDVVDWLQAQPEAAGWDGFGAFDESVIDDLREGLLAVIREAAEPVPAQWCSPVVFEDFAPLPDDLPPVEALEPGMLPETVRDWLLDTSERLQCPVDFPAAAVVVAAGAIIGRQVGIRPGRHDDWTVIPNLWGGVVGRPGVLKTPALNEALKPLRAIENRARQVYEDARAQHEQDALLAKYAAKIREGEIRKLLKKGNEEAARAVLVDDTQPEAPILRRWTTSDVTVEKLGELLEQNPNGILVFRDELTGFLKSLEKDGHEGARAFYLESWDGRGSFTYDRVARGTVHIPHAVVSIFGGIQPGPLQAYLAENATGSGNDGLLPRFQVLVWPDISGEWRQVDRWPESLAKLRAMQAFERLSDIQPHAIHANVDEHDDTPYLRFDDEAQGAFDDWRASLEVRLRGDDLPEVLEAVLAKYRSLVPSLALIFHLLDGGIGPVTWPHLARSLQWAEFLESHTRRVYGMAIDADTHAARLLWRRVVKGEVESPFTARDIKRKHWAGLQDGMIDKALKVLELHGYIACERKGTGGRPTETWYINPAARP